ncbi:MAG: MFS transporter [Candidatus Aenigmarchaeota archaeon]|nr:MFS transporter [Candidatus Aenigmarchaeota archaeon]
MKPALKILILSSFFINLAAGLFGPLYAVFVQRIGGDLLTAGSAYAGFSIALGAMIFFLSRWEDRVRHQEKLIVIARGLQVIGISGYMFIRTPLDLLFVQIALGFSEAIITPAFDSLYSRNLDRGRSASEWGMWESMRAVVIGVAAITGGFVAQQYGFPALFSIMAVISIFAFAASLLFYVHKPVKKFGRKRRRKR